VRADSATGRTMDAMPEPRLLAACWTSAGNVRPGLTADTSPFAIEDRVAAVAAAGFDGIGFELADLDVARATMGLGALRDLIGESGIALVEVEFLNDWWIGGERRGESDARRRRMLEAAQELGADHVKAGGGQPGDTRDPAVLRDELSRLAADAAAHGTRIALEPGAGSGLDLIADAIPAVLDVAHPACGILLDVWHLYRGGIPYDSVVDLLPAEYLFAVELDDAAATPVGTLFDDTFDQRLVCGLGAFDVPEFIRAIGRIGFDGPWGLEHMSERHRTLPLPIALAEARDGALACLAAAGVA
jgi:sugar phosphate isomerase/epimerase